MLELKKKYKFVLIGFLVMTTLNLVILGTLWLKRPPWVRGDRDLISSNPLQRMFVERLDLNKEQIASFNELRDAYKIKIRATLDQIQKNRKTLYDAIGTADSVRIDSLTSAIAAVHKKIEMINVNHFGELRKRLNSQQREEFDQMMDRMSQFLLNRPSRGPGPPPSNFRNRRDQN